MLNLLMRRTLSNVNTDLVNKWLIPPPPFILVTATRSQTAARAHLARIILGNERLGGGL